MKTPQFKQLVKECIKEINHDEWQEKKKQMVIEGAHIIKNIRELVKKEFGIDV